MRLNGEVAGSFKEFYSMGVVTSSISFQICLRVVHSSTCHICADRPSRGH